VAEDPTAFTAHHCANLLRLHAELAEDPECLSNLTPDQKRALLPMHADFFSLIELAAHDQSVAEATRGGNGDGKPARTPKPSVLHQSRA